MYVYFLYLDNEMVVMEAYHFVESWDRAKCSKMKCFFTKICRKKK